MSVLKCECDFPDKCSKWEKYSSSLYSLQSIHPTNEISNSANSRVFLIRFCLEDPAAQRLYVSLLQLHWQNPVVKAEVTNIMCNFSDCI